MNVSNCPGHRKLSRPDLSEPETVFSDDPDYEEIAQETGGLREDQKKEARTLEEIVRDVVSEELKKFFTGAPNGREFLFQITAITFSGIIAGTSKRGSTAYSVGIASAVVEGVGLILATLATLKISTT